MIKPVRSDGKKEGTVPGGALLRMWVSGIVLSHDYFYSVFAWSVLYMITALYVSIHSNLLDTLLNSIRVLYGDVIFYTAQYTFYIVFLDV